MVFWVAMVKVFGLDFFGAVVIVLISWVVRIFLMGLVLSAVAGGASWLDRPTDPENPASGSQGQSEAIGVRVLRSTISPRIMRGWRAQ